MKIIRNGNIAHGGVTPKEKIKMVEIAQKWIKTALFTTKNCGMSKDERYAKIKFEVEKLYAAAGLKVPRVVIVPSPLVAAFAYGISAAWWYLKKKNLFDDATRTATYDATAITTDDATANATRNATDDATANATRNATDDATRIATDDATAIATDDATAIATAIATDAATAIATDAATRNATRTATYAATYDATDDATRTATDAATYDATDDATRTATDAATYDATRNATEENWLLELSKKFCGGFYPLALNCIRRWYGSYQGGNMWASFPSYAEACRNVLGLDKLKCWEKYQAWEELAKISGFRILHEEFCIVCDFPEEFNTIKNGEIYQLHRNGGPAIRWADGFSIWALNGIPVPQWLAETEAENIDPKMILTEKNTDVQREAIRKFGYDRMLKACNAKIIENWTCPKTGLKYTMRHMMFGNIDRRYLCYEHASMPGIFYAKAVPPEAKNCLQMRVFQTCDNPEQMRHDFQNNKYTEKQLIEMLPERVQ